MRSIAIVGAGQSGLLAALGLQQAGYDVTVVSDRSAEAIRTGRVMSGQCLFETALSHERKLGLHFWDDEVTPISNLCFSIGDDDFRGRSVTWVSQFEDPPSSVDQRLKMSRWLDEFVSRGGELHIRRADTDDLEKYAAEYDLVLVAAGRGDQFSTLFKRDAENSPYEEPQRALALIYVSTAGDSELPPQVTFNIRHGVGEFYWMPTLSVHGPVYGLCLSGIPGGPLDIWQGITGIDEQWATFESLVRKYFAWDAEPFAGARPAGPMDSLIGRVTPVVRNAVGTLPSGRHVLAMGDTAITNDPIGGQGANNAIHCAVSYLDSIVDHGNGKFDAEFMARCYARYWDHARHATRLCNDLLLPPKDHVLETLTAAQFHPQVANRFAAMFDNPSDYGEWLVEPDTARRYLQTL
ncbi:flavin-dependent dehydrogenase [Kibdelosporangium banguiense]|uniref:Flavin-dependent dehydrogenase n=1 Tax=Kibdelosporangium banguiense TaxID=1365924 RepID=A0ABS4TRA2_9PSEU|nr:styrene monooxygenase/indole monooxygenase family protein [Kibdelosporangium banguiense]MBP2326935.1 flavin-dependent dehydrogenase [Kibdelosporangium banguiense]